MSRAIHIADARVAFDGRVVIDDLQLQIAPGEFLVVLGPSGCGKSTLLRALGELRPIGGSIRVGGEAAADAWRHLAYVFQEPRLLPWRTAVDNVAVAMRLRGVGSTRTSRRAEAHRQLARVGLADAAGRRAHQLSGGEQQRVAIARALSLRPDVLLLDEPYSALDVANRRALRRAIVDIWKQTGLTIVFVTHDLDEALEIGRRIVVFSNKPTTILADLRPPGSAPRQRDDPAVAAMRTTIASLFKDVDAALAG